MTFPCCPHDVPCDAHRKKRDMARIQRAHEQAQVRAGVLENIGTERERAETITDRAQEAVNRAWQRRAEAAQRGQAPPPRTPQGRNPR